METSPAVPKGESKISPWLYVPSLYFAEGVPYILINAVSVVIYKRLGVQNDDIAFWTSWLYLPWVIKMFWSPAVDLYSTKRRWVYSMNILMGAALGATALALGMPNFLYPSLAFFFLGAFISATQDIAIDGFYMLSLSSSQQAFYTGIRVAFYRLAMIFGTGAVVWAGGVFEQTMPVKLAWSVALGLCGGILALLGVYHKFALPKVEAGGPSSTRELLENVGKPLFKMVVGLGAAWWLSGKIAPFIGLSHGWALTLLCAALAAAAYGYYSSREKAASGGGEEQFIEVFHSYFSRPGIWAMVSFILLYRFGEAMILKIAPLFALDVVTKGGLGLSPQQYGVIYGTLGIIAMMAGGVLGGWIVSKYGFRKSVWPLTVALILPNALYIYIAMHAPSIWLVYLVVIVEQFGIGMGYTAYTIYLMFTAKGKCKTSHFAISTGIMALGMMIPGMISGKLQMAMGYPLFFTIAFLLTIPGMLTLLIIPTSGIDEKDSPAGSAPAH